MARFIEELHSSNYAVVGYRFWPHSLIQPTHSIPPSFTSLKTKVIGWQKEIRRKQQDKPNQGSRNGIDGINEMEWYRGEGREPITQQFIH